MSGARQAALPIVLGLVLSTSANAAPLELDNVLRSATKLHPLVMQAEERLAAAEASLYAARGAFDPTLSAKGSVTPYGDFVAGKADVTLRQATTLWGAVLSAGWRYGRGDIPIYKLADKTATGGQGFLGLEVPLLRGGLIDGARAELGQRRYFRDGLRHDARSVLLALRRAAAHSYWSWVAAGRKLVVDQRLLEIAKKRDAQVAEQVRQGALPRIERLDNQRSILKREGAVIASRRSFERAAIKLSLFLRDDQGHPRRATNAELPRALPKSRMPAAEEVAQDIVRAIAARPQLARLHAQRQAVDLIRRRASNERLPDLRLGLTAQHDIGDEPYESHRTDLLVGLKLRFPLLQRKARGKELAAQAKLAELSAKERLLRDKIEAQVRDAYSALRAAHEGLELARKERKVAHQVEAGERSRLALGSSTLLTVNLREQAAASADKRVIDAAVTYRKAWADYRAVMARDTALATKERS